MIFKRLFRRGTPPPPSLAGGLIEPLAAAGLAAEVVEGDAPSELNLRAPGALVGLRAGVVGRGLVQITDGGPPDFVQVTSEGGGVGHLVRSSAIGFHFLVRREGLAESVGAGWGSQGKIVARREFGGVGMARDFRWEAAMEKSDVAAPQAVAAAEQLNALDLPHEPILALLQEPNTLVLEVAPELFEEAPEGAMPRAAVIRASVFFGGRESIGVAEVEVMRDLCRAIAGAE